MNPSTPYLSNLTPLRGIAALLTVLFHFDLMMGGGGNLLLKFKDSLLFTRFYLMVDFFFILSGFIMCHVYGKWFSDSVEKNEFRQFTIARFARVYPLHFVTLLYCIGLKLAFIAAGGLETNPMEAVSNNWAAIPSHLLLLHSMNVNEWFTWNNASWSISTEWWMYMMFPFLVKPFWKLRSVERAIVVLACLAGYVFIMFVIVPIVTVPAAIPFVAVNPADLSINVSYQYGFLRCLFGFVLGMMVYQYYMKGTAKPLFSNGYVILLLTLGLGLCLHFAVPDVFSVAFFPLILLSAAYGSQRMDAFFGTKPLQRIGDWSFSIYLVHQPLLYTIATIISYLNPPNPKAPAGPPPSMDMLTGWLFCLIFIVFTLLVSFLTYRFVEVPARKWINARWGRKVVLAASGK